MQHPGLFLPIGVNADSDFLQYYFAPSPHESIVVNECKASAESAHPASSPNTRFAAAKVSAISCSPCALDTNPASNAEGAK